MKKLVLIPLALLLFGCLPAEEKNVIQVEGVATIEVAPKFFEVGATVRSIKNTRDGAFADAAAIYTRLQEELPKLDGLESVKITTASAEVETIYDGECLDLRYDEYCPVTGYGAYIRVSVEGSPATSAGSMLSLITELGAESVEFKEFRAENLQEANEQAVKAAVENASYKARLIASSAGATLAGVAKIQSGKDFDKTYMDELQKDMIVVSGTARRYATVPFDIEPQPITVSAQVVAAFEIE